MSALAGLKSLHVSYVAEFVQNMRDPAVIMGQEVYEKMVRDEKAARSEVERLTLVVEKNAQRDNATIERLRTALKVAAEGVCFAQSACGCAVCVARKALVDTEPL